VRGALACPCPACAGWLALAPLVVRGALPSLCPCGALACPCGASQPLVLGLCPCGACARLWCPSRACGAWCPCGAVAQLAQLVVPLPSLPSLPSLWCAGLPLWCAGLPLCVVALACPARALLGLVVPLWCVVRGALVMRGAWCVVGWLAQLVVRADPAESHATPLARRSARFLGILRNDPPPVAPPPGGGEGPDKAPSRKIHRSTFTGQSDELSICRPRQAHRSPAAPVTGRSSHRSAPVGTAHRSAQVTERRRHRAAPGSTGHRAARRTGQHRSPAAPVTGHTGSWEGLLGSRS
jgi:hypothetical protein